jgi:chorismate mutase
MSVLALRGAITLDHDTPEEIHERTLQLLTTLYERNNLRHDDILSIFFTATPDVRSAPPAKSARDFGLVDVPLICAQEMDVDGALPMCLRLLLHLETGLDRSELRHVFLRDAVKLRPELAEPGDES